MFHRTAVKTLGVKKRRKLRNLSSTFRNAALTMKKIMADELV
jgi:hypothetical protein